MFVDDATIRAERGSCTSTSSIFFSDFTVTSARADVAVQTLSSLVVGVGGELIRGTMAQAATPHSYLIVNNVQKAKNVKHMLISASAFGVHEVFVVGQKKLDFQQGEEFLHSLRCQVTRLATLKDCQVHCKERNIRIIGVEIMQNAKRITDHPFHGDSAFIMGNEVWDKNVLGSGLNSAQVAICDEFVYIPQYGGGTASLNVTVAASIVLHSFAVWAKLPLAESVES
ncbi:hypothetical protein PsorP6_011926 [Peronosclerospora sorghi]|uniref:Uncharacterized protein n=1 Tax=Peronosclerospora sorghi TaxID=230839 RepID=A0ACC0WM55_9STRA|nr:hypothetical protein PsorP6_011926 [Peronosclerospora sorghi]